MTLLRILEIGVPILAFLMMVAVGLDVTREDLRLAVGWRRLIAIATAGQAVLLPVAAFLLAGLLTPSSAEVDYLLLFGALPGGGMSNVYVYIARANTALSCLLTAVSCLGAVVTMPLITAAYGAALGRPVGFAVPYTTLFVQLLLLAVIPVIVGAWIRTRYPEVERRYGPGLRVFCTIGIVFIVLVGFQQAAGSFDRESLSGGLAVAAFVAAGMAMGGAVAILSGQGRANRFTLLVEFGVRNLAIAMVIQVTLLGHVDFVAFAALATVATATLMLAAVSVYRRSSARAVEGPAPAARAM